MSVEPLAIDVRGLVRRYGRTDVVDGLNLQVAPGRCYGFFGRNGAGKTTTIKCLLNLIRPTAGDISILGLNPAKDDIAVKSRVAYVPDHVGFYPWMTVRDVINYCASFRPRWNDDTEAMLLDQFHLDEAQKARHLSKGQHTQLALLTAVCAEPDLLVLDEPTSGLDPIIRRQFIQTVIGAYQDAAPSRRTVFVSTHLIAEFEGLIDEFTIIDHGRAIVTMEADAARERFKKIHVRYASEPPALDLAGAACIRRGRELEITVDGDATEVMTRLSATAPDAMDTEALSLEEIFVTALSARGAAA